MSGSAVSPSRYSQPCVSTGAVAAYRADGDWLRDLVAYLDENRRVLGELLATEVPEIAYRAPDLSGQNVPGLPQCAEKD